MCFVKSGGTMIKGYLFDYGGTLDTAGCHWGQMLWHAYERQRIPITNEQFREAYIYGERALGRAPIIQPDYSFWKTLDIKIRLEMEHLCTQGAWEADEREFATKHQAVFDDVYQQVQEITAHSCEVLQRLGNHYPMVLVSNFYGNIKKVLQEFGFDSLFKQVVESTVVGIRKPDPRIFLLGVKALGFQPTEVAVVGDSLYKDIGPARQIGCHTIWFRGEGWSVQKSDEIIPDRVITDLSQIG